VTAEMVAKARDKDLARLEKQASMRSPLIREMKSAVKSVRSSAHGRTNMYKQPSFRHLTVEPEVAESIAPQPGFGRQPPSRGGRRPNHAISIGTAEREAMRNFRKVQPTGSGTGLRTGGLVPLASHGAPKHVPAPGVPEPAATSNNRPEPSGMKKPVRKTSMTMVTVEED